MDVVFQRGGNKRHRGPGGLWPLEKKSRTPQRCAGTFTLEEEGALGVHPRERKRGSKEVRQKELLLFRVGESTVKGERILREEEIIYTFGQKEETRGGRGGWFASRGSFETGSRGRTFCLPFPLPEKSCTKAKRASYGKKGRANTP